jgi:hypothetical protein
MQLVDLLNRFGSCSRACCVGGVRAEADRTWHICYDFLGLNAISRRAVELLPHIDVLLDWTLGSCFFTKLDLASSYHQLLVLALWKTSLLLQLSQSEWNVVPFGLQGSLSLLMSVIN